MQEEIEERWDEEWLLQMDKAWDAIHRILSDGTLNPDGGARPRNLAILGGQQLYRGDDYVISLIAPKQVRDLAVSLVDLDEAWLRERYDAIAADGYGVPKSDEDFGYTWEYFKDLAPFVKRAGQAGRCVIFTVDQ